MEKGYTQKALAKLAEVEAPYLCAVEKGKYDPSWKLLQKVCQVLHVNEQLVFCEVLELPKDAPRQDRLALEMLKALFRQLGLGGQEIRESHRRRIKRN